MPFNRLPGGRGARMGGKVNAELAGRGEEFRAGYQAGYMAGFKTGRRNNYAQILERRIEGLETTIAGLKARQKEF